ncbi:MAG TPA: actin-binding WH2 domain-containing protein, partial [Nostoc sp.]|uniref:actin-binding WH2 domain-containing protein n=1 Tax=Nostoc sp. TaxID=1180 RepID=UPI002D2C4AA1
MIERKSVGIKYFAVLIGFLRDRQGFLEEVRQGTRLPNKIISLLVCSSLFLAGYGGIIGAYHSWMQALSSAIKLPALYLITLLICIPTLYFANIVFGSKRTFGQHLALVLTAVSVTSVLLFSFAPITLFFLITTNNYQFLILLNVFIFALTGFIGISSLYQATSLVLEQDNEGSK